MVGLKCLSARFVIDIKVPIPDNGKMAKCLKCLSARFVIDIEVPIPDHGKMAGLGVSNAFRLDS